MALRISTKPLKDSSLVARDGGPIALQLYASPGYLESHGAPHHPTDLEGHSWVLFRGNEPLRLKGPGKPVTVTPRGRIMCDEMFFVREALRQGAGLGILPTFLADGDVAAGRLVSVLGRWSIPAGRLWIVCHGGQRLPRKVTVFREFVLESLEAP
jgi:DNA-binding transcriptional LysR family regulator